MKRLARTLGLSLLLAGACSDERFPEHPALGRVRCEVRVSRAPHDQPLLVIDKNVEHCGPQLRNPVMRAGRVELADVVLSIDWPRAVPSESQGTLHLRNEGCLMVPRVQVGRAGDLLVLGSVDDITHNPHGWLEGETTVFNLTMLNSSFTFQRKLSRAGLYRIDCDTHKWMRGYIHLFDHPYAAVTGADGVAEFALPAGPRVLRAWHEVLGTLELPVDVREGETTTVEVTFALADRRDPKLISPNEQPWAP